MHQDAIDAGVVQCPACNEFFILPESREAFALLQLRTEINCRIEHGADSNGHLEFVLGQLDTIPKGEPEESKP